MTKVIKISEAASPNFVSAKWKNFLPGKINDPNFSLPLDYTVEGELTIPIKVGGTIFMKRTKRNGVKAEGVFMSSVITDVKTFKGTSVVTTRNSVYLVEDLG